MSKSDALSILDIDLDAFQSRTIHNKSDKRRLNSKLYAPWEESQLRVFLEAKCGLSRKQKIPGRYRTEHDSALEFFENLYDTNGKLLRLIHLDGHADLGLGDRSWTHIIGEWLAKDPLDRRRPPVGAGYCNPGSYVAYAAAARILDSVIYAYPPGGGNDLHRVYFLNNDSTSGFLQLKHFKFLDISCYDELTADKADHVEPIISYSALPITEFEEQEAHHAAFVCQSPGFTSKKADRLLYILADYIDFDNQSDPLPNIQVKQISADPKIGI